MTSTTSSTKPSTRPTTPRPTTTTPAATTTATWQVPASLRGLDVEVVPTSRRVVALTFDGGSSDAGVASVLATLRAAGIKASFFLTGDFSRRYPSQARRIAAEGHRIGNHSDRHLDYTGLTNAAIRADLARAEVAVRDAAGVTPRPLFRFPFGARTPADIRVVNDAGYVAVRWTVDTLGWKGSSGGSSVPSVRQRVLDALRPGEIVLLHLGANPDDGTTLDADALPSIIQTLRDKGYGFITLDALLG
ncbi:MAG TPA: polysaccharide deacetylase family protein [Actinomycetales bacterium]|nr:polysaccharide deacetylase family protein [Actinomycetales bacterium]